VRYVAHGLQLLCPFVLPGMEERSEQELPEVELDLLTRTAVEQAWTGCPSTEIWRGQLGDGMTLAVSRSADGAHLFGYGERALFMLDRSRRVLACAPSEPGVSWQRVLLTKVLPNVALILGYEAVHASAVESPEGAVVVLAPSGVGKTALALALADRGWPLISDDIVTLGHDACGGVRVYPGTPHMNADPRLISARSMPRLAVVLGILGDEAWLSAHTSANEPCSVAALCLFERGGFEGLRIGEEPASLVPLVPYALGLDSDAARIRARFALYGELANSARILRVEAGAGVTPSDIADRLTSELPNRLAAAGIGVPS
jgi:hypothetical protein